MIVSDGGHVSVPVPLARSEAERDPGEVVTVYEPELHDAVANLAAAGFELSIVDESTEG